MIATSILYSAPLIYITNQELIDGHIENAQNVVGAQAAQVKDLASQHTTYATNTVKQYAGDYTSKAQGYIGSARQSSPTPQTQSSNPAAGVKSSDFPTAPKQEPLASEMDSKVNGGAEPVPAS